MKCIIAIAIFYVFTFSAYAQQSNAQASAERGKAIYEQNCLPCHQADGSGVPALAPPLIKGTFVQGTEQALINVLLKGMQGVEIKGEQYAAAMPAFDFLTDQQIADVLTYVRTHFSNDLSAVEVDGVSRARKQSK